MCSSCLCVCIYEWRLRDGLWLDWSPSPDESQILMCQQGWIMHIACLYLSSTPPPLPPHLFSTSCLQPFSSLKIITATSEDIVAFPCPPLPFLVSRFCCWCGPLAVLWSTQLQQLTHSFHQASQKVLCCKPKHRFRAFPDENGKTKVYAVHHSIAGQGREAIDTVWQLRPWLTGVIRGLRLTDEA